MMEGNRDICEGDGTRDGNGGRDGKVRGRRTRQRRWWRWGQLGEVGRGRGGRGEDGGRDGVQMGTCISNEVSRGRRGSGWN